MRYLLNQLRFLRPVDALALVFGVGMSVLGLIFAWTMQDWLLLFAFNILVAISIFLLAKGTAQSDSRLLQIVYDFYPVPLIFASFKEIHVILQSIGRPDYDNVLIAVDRWMFGVDPTMWLHQFTFPLCTEILQIAYASFYFIMLALGCELYLRRDYGKFSLTIFTILYGFFLSYVGYLLVPGVGPRFTLHDFGSLNMDLPGLCVTNTIRDFLNAGESIPKNAVNAIALAQRDVFPSGHTQMTLISMYLAQRYRVKSRYVLHVFGTLLIVATVYLRYHYVIDLVAGIAFMVFTVWTAPKLYAWLETLRGKTRIPE